MPADLYGPLGLLIGLSLAVGALWRDHMRADADDRAQRDVALAGWREQTAATREQTAATVRLAESIEADRADRAERKRRADT